MTCRNLLAKTIGIWIWPLFLFAGSDGKMNNGAMEIGFNFRFPPTSEQIGLVKSQIQRASQILCDATDGQIRITKAFLTQGGASEDRADIWFWPNGGRSGVSFYFNGSNLGTGGRHIDLFQGGIRADIIAHELGHHAFGLGDEYDEQSRWGGPCGIGPGFDAGAWDERNHSIMQQIGGQVCATPDSAHPGLFIQAGGGCFTDADCASGQTCEPVFMSELTVASNHDLLRAGSVPTCPVACTDPQCTMNYNSDTMRFEATQQTLIHGGDSDWVTLRNNYPFITIPAGLPQAVMPESCKAVVQFVEEVVGTDQLMIIVDRSGSMSAPVSSGATQTRLDFAKAAERAFVNLEVDRNTWMVGQVSFNESPRLDRAISLLPLSDVNSFISTSVNTLVAGGNTGIGNALSATLFEFQRVKAAGRVRTAFLLSDGENNTGVNPRDAAELLKNEGVRVFTVPVGSSADKALLSDIASTTGGSMFDSPTGRELPPIYIELAAKLGGHALIIPTTTVVQRPIVIGKREVSATLQTTFSVESGAEELVVFFSAKTGKINEWGISIFAQKPDGTYIYENQLKPVSDPYFKLVRIQNPQVGTWNFYADSSTSGTVESYLVVYAKNPLPDCFVGSTKPVVHAGQQATFLASASYGGEIDSGVSFTGEVVRPDGSKIPVTFTKDFLTRSISAQFGAFIGRGNYEVRLTCDVSAVAKVFQGESIFSGPDRVAPIPAFKRTATARFFYDAPSFPRCTTNDCDNDGIPNDQEPTGDLDGDGVPNYLDDDANGNDIHDSLDPAPFKLPDGYKSPTQMYPPSTTKPSSTTTATTATEQTKIDSTTSQAEKCETGAANTLWGDRMSNWIKMGFAMLVGFFGMLLN